MLRWIVGVLRGDDRGQDVAEYCLVTALIALIALGIFYHVSGGMQGMWTSANTTLVAGNSAGEAGSAGGAGEASAPVDSR
jgi:Flp pilus assembly pilin Flp